MGNAHAGAWRYTASYGWNWRSARALGSALGSLALPMPSWLRMVVARSVFTRTALQADAEGIWGSAGPPLAGPAGPVPCPWTDITDIVVWNYDHLRIIGLVRRGDVVGGGPAALASRPLPQSQQVRHRAFRRHPSFPAFIAPDGSPYEAGNVVTTNGWCVDIARLQATVRHFAPRARFVDLSGFSTAPEAGPFAFEVFAGLMELIGWWRIGWLLGTAASAAVLALAAADLGTKSYAPVGVVVGAAALALFIGRAVLVRRRRHRSTHPEGWLDSGREDMEGGPLARLRRGPLAAWALRVSPRAGRRTRSTSRRRSRGAIRRGR